MTRVLAQCVPLEMALLGLLELALSFLLIEAMVTMPGALDLLGAASSAGSASGTVLAVMLALTVATTAATIGLYRPEVCLDRRRLLLNATVAGLMAFPAVLLVSGGLRAGLSGHDVIWLSGLLAVWLAGMLLIRLALGLVAPRARFMRRILIVGSGPRAARLRALAEGRRGRLFQPVAAEGAADLAPDRLRAGRIWGVVFTADASLDPAATFLLDSKLRGIRVFDESGFCEHHLGRIALDTIDTRWLLSADGFTQGRVADAAKRVLDIVVSLGLLLLTLPLMLMTALLVRLDGRGPVFYRQQRAGLHGRPFTLYKFRSMAVDAEAGGKPRWAQEHDPRVTRVGAIIRPLRIDELPQLLNVLRGEMSMIGPRPERPHFVEHLARVIPFYRERAYVKPGITGWAQVNFPYGASVEDAREKLAYDLYYVKNRGLVLDLLILAATVRVILFREGAR